MITPDHIADFRARGHVAVPGLFDPAEPMAHVDAVHRCCAGSAQHHRPVAERSTYQRAFVQEMNLWQRDESIRPLVFSTRLADAAAALLGVGRVRIYHDQALSKEPRGGPTPWHVDQHYWPIDSDATVTAWVPLQDVPLEMGPLRFARASHRIEFGRDLPISESSDAELAGEIGRRALHIDEQAYTLGDVSFHAGWTFHGSRPNRSDRWRHVLTVIYLADGARLLRPERPEQQFDRRMWLPDIPVGGPVDSWLNPVVEPGVIDRLPPPAAMVGTVPAEGFGGAPS